MFTVFVLFVFSNTYISTTTSIPEFPLFTIIPRDSLEFLVPSRSLRSAGQSSDVLCVYAHHGPYQKQRFKKHKEVMVWTKRAYRGEPTREPLKGIFLCGEKVIVLQFFTVRQTLTICILLIIIRCLGLVFLPLWGVALDMTNHPVRKVAREYSLIFMRAAVCDEHTHIGKARDSLYTYIRIKNRPNRVYVYFVSTQCVYVNRTSYLRRIIYCHSFKVEANRGENSITFQLHLLDSRRSRSVFSIRSFVVETQYWPNTCMTNAQKTVDVLFEERSIYRIRTDGKKH